MSSGYVVLPNSSPVDASALIGWNKSCGVTIPASLPAMSRIMVAVAVAYPRVNLSGSTVPVTLNAPLGLQLLRQYSINNDLQLFLYYKDTDDSSYSTNGTFSITDSSVYAYFGIAVWSYDKWSDVFSDGQESLSVVVNTPTAQGITSGLGSLPAPTPNGLVTSVAFALPSTAGDPLTKVNGVWVPSTNATNNDTVKVTHLTQEYSDPNNKAIAEYQYPSIPAYIGIIQYARAAQSSWIITNNAELATVGATTNDNQGTSDFLTVTQTGSSTLTTVDTSALNGAKSYRCVSTSTSDIATLSSSIPTWNYFAGSIKFTARGLVPSTTVCQIPGDTALTSIPLVTSDSSGKIKIVGVDTGITTAIGTQYTFDIWFRGRIQDSSFNQSISINANVYDHSVSTATPAATVSTSFSWRPTSQQMIPNLGAYKSAASIYIDDVVIRSAPGFVGPPTPSPLGVSVGLVGTAVKVVATTGTLPITTTLFGDQPIHAFTNQVPGTLSTSVSNIATKITMLQSGYFATGARYYKIGTTFDNQEIKAGLYLFRNGSSRRDLIATGSRVQQPSDPEGWIDIQWDQGPISVSPIDGSYYVAIHLPGTGPITIPYSSTGGGSVISNSVVSATVGYILSGIIPDLPSGFAPSSWYGFVDISLSKIVPNTEKPWLSRNRFSKDDGNTIVVNSAEGSLLVAVGAGPSLPTAPSGWTSEAYDSTNGYFVYSKNAIAGANSITFSTAVDKVVVYEFPAGSSVVAKGSSTAQESISGSLTLSSGVPFVNTIIDIVTSAPVTPTVGGYMPRYVVWEDEADELLYAGDLFGTQSSLGIAVYPRTLSSSPYTRDAKLSSAQVVPLVGGGSVQPNTFTGTVVAVNVPTSWTALPYSVGLVGSAVPIGVTTGSLPISTGLVETLPSYLYDSSSTPTQPIVFGTSRVIGRKLVVTAEGYVSTAGRFYYNPSWTTKTPVTIGLWRTDTEELLALTSVSDPEEGWVIVKWPSPVPLYSGVTYTVAIVAPGVAGFTSSGDIVGSVMTGPDSGKEVYSPDRRVSFNSLIQPTNSVVDGDTVTSSYLFASKAGDLFAFTNSIDETATGKQRIWRLTNDTWVMSYEYQKVQGSQNNFSTVAVTFDPDNELLYFFSRIKNGIAWFGEVYDVSSGTLSQVTPIPLAQDSGLDTPALAVSLDGTLVAINPAAIYVKPLHSSAWVQPERFDDDPLLTDWAVPTNMAAQGVDSVVLTLSNSGDIHAEDLWGYTWNEFGGSWSKVQDRTGAEVASDLFVSTSSIPWMVFDNDWKTVDYPQGGNEIQIHDNSDVHTLYTPGYRVAPHVGNKMYVFPRTLDPSDGNVPIMVVNDINTAKMELPTQSGATFSAAVDIEVIIGPSISPNRRWTNVLDDPNVVTSGDGSAIVSYQQPATGDLMLMFVRSRNTSVFVDGWALLANSLFGSHMISVFSKESGGGQEQSVISQSGELDSEFGVSIYGLPAGSQMVSSATGNTSVILSGLDGTFTIISVGSYENDDMPAGYRRIEWSTDRLVEGTAIGVVNDDVAEPLLDIAFHQDHVGSIATIQATVADDPDKDVNILTMAMSDPSTAVAGPAITVGLVGTAYQLGTAQGSIPLAVGLTGSIFPIMRTSGILPISIGPSSTERPIGKTSGSTPMTVGLTGGASLPTYIRSGSIPLGVGLVATSTVPVGVVSGTLPIGVKLDITKTFLVKPASGEVGVGAGLSASASPVGKATGSSGVTVGLTGSAWIVLSTTGTLNLDVGLVNTELSGGSRSTSLAFVNVGLEGIASAVVSTSGTLPSNITLRAKSWQVRSTTGELPINIKLAASYRLPGAERVTTSSASSFYEGDGSTQSYVTAGHPDAPIVS
jgi:hypothetical protein